MFSFASTTPVTADTRSSSAFFGGVRRGMRLPPPSSSRRYAYGDWGLPPKPTESPTASLPTMNRYPRSSSPTLPRDGAFHKVNVTAAAVCEARESPRMVLPGSDCPRAFTESLGRCVRLCLCLHARSCAYVSVCLSHDYSLFKIRDCVLLRSTFFFIAS